MKEHREELTKILVTAVLLIILTVPYALKLIRFPFWVWLILYLIPYLLIGWEVLIEAFQKIRQLEPLDESFLMSAATIGALILGEYPEAVFVLLFFSIGELFEDLASDRSRKSISALMDLRPDRVTLERDGALVTVFPEEAEIGEIMVVEVGDRLPLDGVIIDGSTALDTSALTGESVPQSAVNGESVMAGCINLSAVIKVRITCRSADSTVSKILDLIETSDERKAKSETFIHRFAKVYTPIMVVLAVLLAVLPSVVWGNPIKWITEALTLLVISCPCALVVSVPLAYFNGIGAASRLGILIKGAASLETLSRLKTVIFDKTGTLTRGNFAVTVIHPQHLNEQKLLEIAALAENYSNHPISVSLQNACREKPDPARLGKAEEYAGEGVAVEIDGKTVLVGNDRLMARFGISHEECSHTGTVVHIAVDGIYEGHIVIADQIKETAPEAVTLLHREKIKTVMLTGDRYPAAQEVAHMIGIDAFCAELLPADKVAETEKLSRDAKIGPCAFVGDGINDAPVLTRADLGVSMGTIGSDAAIEASNVVLMDDNLLKLPRGIHLARKTCKTVRQNIVFCLGVKSAVLLLAIFGLSNLWIASFADVGVLVLAVLNSARNPK